MKNYTVKNSVYSITVSTHGAELTSFKNASGYEYVWQCGGDWKDQAPLLFPVCGRLKGQKYSYCGKEYLMNPHGFIKDSEFELVSCDGSHIIMAFSSNEQTKKIYPFDFSVTADYELKDDGLIFTFTVKNEGEENLPYMFGWHPGFNLPCDEGLDINDYRLDFGTLTELNWFTLQNGPFINPESVKYPLSDNAYQLCEDEIYKNDTMIFTGHENKLTLSAPKSPFFVDFAWSDNLPYLCVWKEEFNSSKYVCLEPWTDVPSDGVTDENFETRKMQRLESGKSASYTYKVKVER